MIGLITFFLVLCYIVVFISSLCIIHLIAMQVSCRFSSEVFLTSGCFLSRMPLYAVACVRVNSFAPCILNSLGISRFSGSRFCLFAPCLASVLLFSLPQILLYPLTHCRVILADLCLIRCAAFLKNSAFFMSIHPSFSQFSRWVVSPSITYLESMYILVSATFLVISSCTLSTVVGTSVSCITFRHPGEG